MTRDRPFLPARVPESYFREDKHLSVSGRFFFNPFEISGYNPPTHIAANSSVMNRRQGYGSFVLRDGSVGVGLGDGGDARDGRAGLLPRQ
jgi:hypothetical protein